MSDTTVPTGPVDKGMQTTMIAISATMTALGFIAVVLRVIARVMLVRKLGADDILMISGFAGVVGYLFIIIYGKQYGMGLHTSDVIDPSKGPDMFTNAIIVLKLIYAVQLTYNTAIALVKLSIVAFYLRLATIESSFRIQSWATIGFLTVFYVATQIATSLQCRPIKDNWNLNPTPHCFNTLVYFYVVAAINIVLDIWILVMPLNTLRNIKRPKRDKIVLFIVFGIGGFSCISSIVRLYTIKVFAESKDQFYDGAPINLWSFIELNVAIVCASVPAMKPLFTKNVRERMTNASKGGYGSNNHQMIPLSDSDKNNTTSFRDKMNKNTYSANAVSSKYGSGGSDEHIISKHGGIEYEREFTVEEQYVGDSHVLPKAPQKTHQ